MSYSLTMDKNCIYYPHVGQFGWGLWRNAMEKSPLLLFFFFHSFLLHPSYLWIMEQFCICTLSQYNTRQHQSGYTSFNQRWTPKAGCQTGYDESWMKQQRKWVIGLCHSYEWLHGGAHTDTKALSASEVTEWHLKVLPIRKMNQYQPNLN